MKHTLLIALLSVGLVACQGSDDSPVTHQSSHPVSVNMGSYTTASVMDLIIPSAHASE